MKKSLAVVFLALGTVASFTPVKAQDAPAAVAAATAAPVASTAAAAPATAAAAAQPSLWRFLGVPQTARGLRTLRSRVVNRNGNFPGLERKPPVLPLTDPANLESPIPAIKAAAEIKQAEDMKKQKIKAIKYLATLGCGCYDKNGKITDALLAGTDDCTPDVRLAVIEAIEDNVNKSCCQACGTTSCCNQKVRKRLSEMAYEYDDEGCPVEPSEEIRRAAKRVFAKCCPGGIARGPIEPPAPADEPLQEAKSVEMIPAPKAEKDDDTTPEPEKIRGESVKEGEGIRGESMGDDADDSMDLDDSELKNPFKDNDDLDGIDPSAGDADELILYQAEVNKPIEVKMSDLSGFESTTKSQQDRRNQVPSKPVERRWSPTPVRVDVSRQTSAVSRQTAEALPVVAVVLPARVIEVQPVELPGASVAEERHVPEQADVMVPPPNQQRSSVLQNVAVEPAYRMIESPQVRSVLQATSMEDAESTVTPTLARPNRVIPPMPITTPPMSTISQSGTISTSTISTSALAQLLIEPERLLNAFGDVAAHYPAKNELLLNPRKKDGLRVGTSVELIRMGADGPEVIGMAVIRVLGRSLATAELVGPEGPIVIQTSDKFIVRY